MFMHTGESLAITDEATDSNAEVMLELRLNIPQILSLRIGHAGMVVDTVTFESSEALSKRPVIKSDISPPFIISSNTSQGVTLSVDTTTGLRDGEKFIPMNAICWKGAGDLEGSDGCFHGAASQKLKSFYGKGVWTGNYIFEYHRSYKHLPGNYTGKVTYTLTTP